jgi:hypothetical protein
MRSALAKIQEQEGTHDHDQEQAAFGKMEEAITGLMELTYGTTELQNPPELPREFATRFPYDDVSPTSRVRHRISDLGFLSSLPTLCLIEFLNSLDALFNLPLHGSFCFLMTYFCTHWSLGEFWFNFVQALPAACSSWRGIRITLALFTA